MFTYVIPPWITISFSVLFFTLIISFTLFYNYSSTTSHIAKEIYGIELNGSEEGDNTILNLLFHVINSNTTTSEHALVDSSHKSIQESRYHYKNLHHRSAQNDDRERERDRSKGKRRRRDGDYGNDDDDDGDIDYFYTARKHESTLQKQRDMAITLL